MPMQAARIARASDGCNCVGARRRVDGATSGQYMQIQVARGGGMKWRKKGACDPSLTPTLTLIRERTKLMVRNAISRHQR
jgi:hypothetical protein